MEPLLFAKGRSSKLGKKVVQGDDDETTDHHCDEIGLPRALRDDEVNMIKIEISAGGCTAMSEFLVNRVRLVLHGYWCILCEVKMHSLLEKSKILQYDQYLYGLSYDAHTMCKGLR